jgi:hypothetical protein
MGALLRNLFVSLFLVILSVCCTAVLPSSAQITFQRTYGGSADEFSSCVRQTADGGYIVIGQTKSFGAGSTDVYLVKTDSLGNDLWAKTYGGVARDDGCCVRQTTDGGYVLAGDVESFGAGFSDFYLVKTDSLGDSLWAKVYGGGGGDCVYSLDLTSDSGYLMAGFTVSFGEGLYDVYAIKTDSLGDSLWTRTYGDSSTDRGYSAQQTSDGGYIIAGETESFGAGLKDIYLIKTAPNGDSSWTRTFGGAGYDQGYSVQQTSDGGYIIAGATSSFGAGSGDVYLIRVDSLGDTLWTKTFGDTDLEIGYSVKQVADGGFIIAGETYSFGAGANDAYLIRTDSSGLALWTRTYGGTDREMAFCVEQTLDGGYVVTGNTRSFGAGENDIFLIKTDENGLTGISESSSRARVPLSSVRLLQNHPNPFHHSTLIFYSLPATAQVTLSIYDITGRLVETLVNEMQQPGIHQVRWNREDSPCGVYFYRLRVGEFVETMKMVVVE